MPGNRHFLYTEDMLVKKISIVLAGLSGLILTLLFAPYFFARLKPLKPLPVPEIAPQVVSVNYPADVLQIPSLGIVAPIQYVTEQTEAVYQAALQQGVVHFPGTALPGALGNVYIFGHSSDYLWSPGEYKTIFARLPEIAVDADIFVTDHEGQRYWYQVTETKVVNPKDLSVLDQNQYQDSRLTLQTSYPLGTALQRFIVVAKLQE